MGIASMRQFQCVPTTYVFSMNEFFTINFFLKNIFSTTFAYSKKEHVEMNNVSCRLSCTCYASDSLS